MRPAFWAESPSGASGTDLESVHFRTPARASGPLPSLEVGQAVVIPLFSQTLTERMILMELAVHVQRKTSKLYWGFACKNLL
jgi:hypothetical protein